MNITQALYDFLMIFVTFCVRMSVKKSYNARMNCKHIHRSLWSPLMCEKSYGNSQTKKSYGDRGKCISIRQHLYSIHWHLYIFFFFFYNNFHFSNSNTICLVDMHVLGTSVVLICSIYSYTCMLYQFYLLLIVHMTVIC